MTFHNAGAPPPFRYGARACIPHLAPGHGETAIPAVTTGPVLLPVHRYLYPRVGAEYRWPCAMRPKTSPHLVQHDRKSARFPFEADLTVLLPGSSPVHGHCRDLSHDGLGAYLGREIEPGEPVLLQFALTPSARIARSARVVHRLGLRHGFEFLKAFDPRSA